MNTEKLQLLLIRGAIAELSEEDRKGIELAAEKLREVVKTHNDHGKMALALVGAEWAAE
jgi:hypothetical protein